MYIITTVFIAQLMFVNMGFLVYSAINWYSYLQMKLTASQKKLGDKEDTIDYIVGDFLVTENDTCDALNGINNANFAVLISKGSNMVCFYPPIEEYHPEYELSDIQFISVKVVIDSIEHNIRLKTPEYTFYIVGNELNVDWVRYYFIKYLSIGLSSDIQYEMTIIDDDVQFVVINENQSLVINKDSYDVFDYVDEDEDIEDNKEEEDDQDDEDNKDLLGEEDDQDEEQDEDPTELSVERMIELEEEIRQEQQQPPLEYDLNMDNMIDKIIADYDMSNMVIFSQDNVALVNESIQAKDVSNNLLEEQEKTQGWFNLF
jgi:hypothetical protein